MADDTVPRYNNASPGLTGAIKDAISAAAKTIAPRQFRQEEEREKEVSAGEPDTTAPSAGKQAQSSDASNGY